MEELFKQYEAVCEAVGSTCVVRLVVRDMAIVVTPKGGVQ